MIRREQQIGGMHPHEQPLHYGAEAPASQVAGELGRHRRSDLVNI